ncbi:MAG: DsrE/DsrF/TusD sulfur relay family protein [Promethearchaeota archaeon]
MLKFSFVITAEPYKYQAIDTAINLGEAIIKKGHQVAGIFFLGSGVYNIKKDRKLFSSIRDLPKRLQKFIEKSNADIAACSTWISITGLKESDFIKRACLDGLGGLSELIGKSDRVVFFGPGR